MRLDDFAQQILERCKSDRGLAKNIGYYEYPSWRRALGWFWKKPQPAVSEETEETSEETEEDGGLAGRDPDAISPAAQEAIDTLATELEQAKVELAEAQAEVARLRAELAKRPPREAPADLTPDEQLAFNLDEILSPYQAREFPDTPPGSDPPPDEPGPDPTPTPPPVPPPPAPEPEPTPTPSSPPPAPEPDYKAINQAFHDIFTITGRTCNNVADILNRLPLDTWDEAMRRQIAEELWRDAVDPMVFQDGSRVPLIEEYFDGATIPVFATDIEVLEFDVHGGLQIKCWETIATMMEPKLVERRKKYQEQQRKAEAYAIMRYKLPRVRKLKPMKEHLARLAELEAYFNNEPTRRAAAYVMTMKTDDPDFADCGTVLAYLARAQRKKAK